MWSVHPELRVYVTSEREGEREGQTDREKRDGTTGR